MFWPTVNWEGKNLNFIKLPSESMAVTILACFSLGVLNFVDFFAGILSGCLVISQAISMESSPPVNTMFLSNCVQIPQNILEKKYILQIKYRPKNFDKSVQAKKTREIKLIFHKN